MTPVNKLYLKTFIYTGLPFGISMMLLDYTDGKELMLWKFVFLVLFFGFFMSAILVSHHVEKLKALGIKTFTDKNLSVFQSNSIKTYLTVAELTEKLKTDPQLGKMKISTSENGIEIKSPFSWSSWGECISIKLRRIDENEIEYHVSSQPKLRFQYVDYGKNLSNLLLIEKAVLLTT